MPRQQSSSNALDILKKDHREIIAKFRLYEKLDNNDKKQELVADICNSLTIHCTCEEELLYPYAQRIIDKSQVYVGEIEHGYMRELMDTISEGNSDDKERDALVKVLGEYTHAHIKQEENELFPLLKNSVVDLKKVGIAMLELKLKMVDRFRKFSAFEDAFDNLDLPTAKMN